MEDIKRVILLTRLTCNRLLRNLLGPVVEVNIEELVDRLGNKISQHELLTLFEHQSEEESIQYYHDYNKRLYEIQDTIWLSGFIDVPKDIHYWQVPWGGSLKQYSEKHLSLSYSQEYINRLKLIRGFIANEGYHPEKYGYITGELLLDSDGNKRFIVWNGHRRALSLAHSGYKKIKVEVSGGDRWNGEMRNHSIRLTNVSRWKNVKNGLYTRDEAITFFKKYFS